MNILIYGSKGYIGKNIKEYLLKNNNINILQSNYNKITHKNQVIDDIKILKPDRIISCIGFVKLNNNISTTFLENNKYLHDNIQNNLYIHILLSDICLKYNIHFTYIGTGCLYSSENNQIFSEDDEINFFKSNYSIVKGFTDKILSLNKDKILILRLRQCLNNDTSPQNFLNKFLNFDNVNDIQNSYTVIPSIFPIICKLIINKYTGKFNCVNKGSINVKEINEIFGFKNKNIIDRNLILKKYSNNILSTKKLESIYYVDNIKNAICKLQKKSKYCI